MDCPNYYNAWSLDGRECDGLSKSVANYCRVQVVSVVDWRCCVCLIVCRQPKDERLLTGVPALEGGTMTKLPILMTGIS